MRDTIIASTILLLLSITPNILQAVEADEVNCFLTPRYEVHVINNLPSNAAMTAYCASGDHTVGTRTVGANEDYDWKFCQQVFGRSKYFCHLWWGSKDAEFDVFNGSIGQVFGDDGQSYWSARGDGIYLSDKKDGTYAKKYDWREK